jgi:hypothetical protein
MEESSLWRERYRVLFDRSVAGIILTNVEGRIITAMSHVRGLLGLFQRGHACSQCLDFYFH